MGSKSGGPVSGQVMTAEEREAEEKRIAIREQNRTTIAGAIFSRLSRVPFVNIWLRKKISTSREVVREETGLFDDLVAHDKSFRNLENIDILLREDDAQAEARALAAENKLAEERRKAEARERDDAIYRKKKEREEGEIDMKNKYELEIEEANYKIQLQPLKKNVEKFEKPEPEPKKKTTRGRSQKQKDRDDAQRKYEKEVARIEAMRGRTAEGKEDLKKSAAKDREVELEKIDKMP